VLTTRLGRSERVLESFYYNPSVYGFTIASKNYPEFCESIENPQPTLEQKSKLGLSNLGTKILLLTLE